MPTVHPLRMKQMLCDPTQNCFKNYTAEIYTIYGQARKVIPDQGRQIVGRNVNPARDRTYTDIH